MNIGCAGSQGCELDRVVMVDKVRLRETTTKMAQAVRLRHFRAAVGVDSQNFS